MFVLQTRWTDVACRRHYGTSGKINPISLLTSCLSIPAQPARLCLNVYTLFITKLTRFHVDRSKLSLSYRVFTRVFMIICDQNSSSVYSRPCSLKNSRPVSTSTNQSQFFLPSASQYKDLTLCTLTLGSTV